MQRWSGDSKKVGEGKGVKAGPWQSSTCHGCGQSCIHGPGGTGCQKLNRFTSVVSGVMAGGLEK